jgi:exodeoxyribonuclease V beta subunit
MMHTAWRRGGIGSLAGWLETQMIEAAADERERADAPESRQRRLETDAAAVQVQTVHAAKGLQYPVVLVPFLWDKPTLPKSAIVVPVFHDPDPDAHPAGDPRQRFVDVGISAWPGYGRHVALSKAEGNAEESRLLYVALTRAQHRLVVWWVDHASEADETNLHRILTRHADEPGSTDLTRLLERAGGTIKETYLRGAPGTAPYEPPEGPDHRPLEVAVFDRSIDRTWRRVSFTSLSPEHSGVAAADEADRPVRDDEPELDDVEETGDGTPETADAGALPLAAMPRGAAFGTLVHNVLERVPFDDADLDDLLRDEIRRAAGPSWDLDHDALAAGIAAALATPLGPSNTDPALVDIPDARTLKEMVFEFPVRTGGEPWTVEGIAEVMALHLPPSDPRRQYAERLAAGHTNPFRGYLVGAIDYTAIVPGADGNDRYVVMDYKTNTLPAESDAPAPTDYRADRLAGAMEHSHYLLQSILYQVALHRYLQWRLPGYDPERNLGGTAYLFVRGMIGPDTPVVDGERCGVYRWNPPADLIVDLSRRFAEGGNR